MTLKGLPYPLRLGSNKTVPTLEDEDLKSEEIKATLKTSIGERVYRPELGNNIVKYLFMGMGQTRRNAIKDEVVRALNDNVDDIVIQTIEVLDDEETQNTDVLVIYYYQGKRKKVQVNLV